MKKSPAEMSFGRRTAVRALAATFIGTQAAVVAACGGGGHVAAAPSQSSKAPRSNNGAESGDAVVGQGFDVSFPQCGEQLPSPDAFAIVGVNGNLPTQVNPCFDKEASWAEQSSGKTAQPKLAVYTTAANPGDQHVPTWPQTGQNKFGLCTGGDDRACAFEYGKDRATADLQTVGNRAVQGLRWYIDVEPEYSWELSPDGQSRNAADLEGMTDTLRSKGIVVGFYSSPSIWQKIVGDNVAPGSSLLGADDWVLGAHSAEEAQANCSTPAFSGGKVVVAQYVTSSLDRDIAC